jgi:multidrug transporter EmrE-like cation transporter
VPLYSLPLQVFKPDTFKPHHMNTIFLGYLWCALAAVASALASYLIKTSNTSSFSNTLLGEHAIDLSRWLYLACAVGAYGIGFVFYTLALKKLPMSLAYPVMTAMTIVLVAIVGTLAMEEPLGWVRIAGVLLIMSGAFLVAQ